jgi:hypothetical protein
MYIELTMILVPVAGLAVLLTLELQKHFKEPIAAPVTRTR